MANITKECPKTETGKHLFTERVPEYGCVAHPEGPHTLRKDCKFVNKCKFCGHIDDTLVTYKNGSI